MRSALIYLSLVSWALWLGGTIAVFVFGGDFRAVLSDATFHEAAHAMFQVFGKYQLVLAGISLMLSGLLLVNYPSKYFVLLVGILVLASGMSVTFGLGLLPAMEVLRNEGRTASPEFMKLHGKSMISLLLQAVVLLGSGWIILKSKEPPAPRLSPSPVDLTRGFEPGVDHRVALSDGKAVS